MFLYFTISRGTPHKVYSLINVIKKQNINTSVVTPRLIHSYMTKDLTKGAAAVKGSELAHTWVAPQQTTILSEGLGHHRRRGLQPAYKVRQANYDGYKCSAK